MKLFKKIRKGFTLIELVVVIAVIAILSAVSIVSYVAITNKAKESNDHSMIDQINLSVLSSSTLSKKNTLHDILEDLKEDAGFGVEKLKPELKDAEFVYSRSMNKFAYWKDNKVVYPTDVANNSAAAGVDLWFFKEVESGASLSDGHSYYAKSAPANATITVDGGFDVGSQTFSEVKYVNSDASKEVLIRTAGGTLQLGTGSGDSEIAKGTIIHYGNSDKAVVYTSGNSFHTHGAVGRLEVKAGKAVVEQNGIAYLVEAKETGVELVEKDGGRFIIPSGVSTTDIPVAVAETIGYTTTESNYDNASTIGDKSYQIGSLDALESFRDLVNGGFSFKGVTVKLTANITLRDGWKPIGEGSRDVNVNNYVGSYADPNGIGAAFSGVFDGNHKTISNLNNKGYIPSMFSVDGTKVTVNKVTHLEDTYEAFVYGFFGIVNNATIKDLTFTNVNIDFSEDIPMPNATTDQKIAKADSVGALAGYSAAGLNVSGITVSGSIKALDAVAGVVGRAYGVENDDHKAFSMSYCTNNAEITASGEKAAGILGFINKNGLVATFSNNTNTGKISSKLYSAGIVVLQSPASVALTSNSNSANLYAAESTTSNNVGLAYVAISLGIEPTASSNSNTGTAYLANAEQATSIVCKVHSPANSGTELNS